MIIQLNRYYNDQDLTFGILAINGVQKFHTLERPHHEVKIPGKTRIPSGDYKISLYTEGEKNKLYASKYQGEGHRGMLLLNEVPGFSGVLIHIGNFAWDSQGCILIGRYPMLETKRICSSYFAYWEFYKIVLAELLAGANVTIDIRDEGAIYQKSQIENN